MSLILASTSTYRRAQLEQLGCVFDCVRPNFDEEAAKDLSLPPRQLAAELARGKAESLRAKYPDAAILGADQLVAFAGQVLGKPGSEAAAIAQLEAMAGKTHELITSVYLCTPERNFTHTDIARMQMRPLTRAQIEAYVAFDKPVDCAGSYKLECAGIGLFETIDSRDFSAIQGLPLMTLSSWFRELSLPSKAFGFF